MRKRAASTPDMTLAVRRALKRSVEEGAIRVYDNVEKRLRTIPELLQQSGAGDQGGKRLFLSAPELGAGVYGQVHSLHDEHGEPVSAVKIVGCLTSYAGDYCVDPFRSERVEPRMARFLWKHLGDTGVTPHLLAPVGQAALVPWTTPRQLEDDAEQTYSAVHCMEYANNGVLRYYLAPLTRVEFNLHFRVILFQVAYTLGAIFLRFPGWRHNDAKGSL